MKSAALKVIFVLLLVALISWKAQAQWLPPNADFTADPVSGATPLSVTFSDQSTGVINRWLWDFGDGTPPSNNQNPTHIYNNPGTYTVSLTVKGPGGSDTHTKTDYISALQTAPIADFTANPLSGTTPLSVTFSDQSTGVITSWLWDFGDGTPPSNNQNPTHIYSNPGTYTVTLTVTGSGGSDTQTKTDYISALQPAPIADFSANPLSGATPLSVTFSDQSTGVINSWLWDFGDGTPLSNNQNPTHIYPNPGTYTVSLTVTGPNGSDTHTKTDYISALPPAPIADFSANPLSGATPLSVTFSDQSTGVIDTWQWDFGDGTPPSSDQNPTHIYNNPGTYTVSLTVTGPNGSDTHTKTDYISALPPAPIADFSANPLSGATPLSVTFSDQSTGVIDTWQWDFGDGTPPSSDQNPTHIYNNPGTYTVSLTVTGPNGSDTHTKTDYISALPPAPIADFSANPLSGATPLSVTFSDQSTGVIDTWQWDFGDGTPPSSDQNPTHIYNNPGTYTVSLTVTGPNGSDTHTKTDYISALPPAPIADFSANPLSGATPLSVTFSDQSTGVIDSWLWDFGDGTPPSSDQNPTHIYNNPGTYTVSLTVTGPNGSDTHTKTDYISALPPAPIADFSANPLSGATPLSVTFSDQSTGVIDSWLWDFGDGTPPSNNQNPTHIYPNPGTYTVSLTVTGPGGSDTQTKTDYISALQPASNPNIIFFLSDDMGWGDSRVYNPNSQIPMPNLDRLAAEGMWFSDAHTAAARCAPTRYSAMTGNYHWRGRYPFGQWDYTGGSQILSNQWTIADILQNKGYNTAFFGKLHLGGDFYLKNSNVFANSADPEVQIDFARGLQNGPLDYGFNYSYPLLRGIHDSPYAFFENDGLVGNPNNLILWASGTYGCSEIIRNGIGMPYWDSCQLGPSLTQKAIEFIDQHHQTNLAQGTDTPFFLYYASQSAHAPYTPPDFFHGEPVNGITGMTPHTDMIYEIDVALGMLIDALEQSNLSDNTLIIFTSDNGGIPNEISFGHDAVGGLRGSKGTIWEGGHRVPFVAKWGDGTLAGSVIPPGTTSNQLIGVHDLAATLAALVGQSLPADQAQDSLNFLPVLLGQQDDTDPVRDHLIMQVHEPAQHDLLVASAIREGEWKLILDEYNDILGLYNLAVDLAETNNLMHDPSQAARIERMRDRFLQIRCSIPLNLDIDNQILSSSQIFEACDIVTAGPSVTITSTGDITFQAGNRVVLKNGFTVIDGARLRVVVDPSTVY